MLLSRMSFHTNCVYSTATRLVKKIKTEKATHENIKKVRKVLLLEHI